MRYEISDDDIVNGSIPDHIIEEIKKKFSESNDNIKELIIHSELLTTLTELAIGATKIDIKCQALASISGITCREVYIHDCTNLTEITGPLQSRRAFSIFNCPRLLSIPQITGYCTSVTIKDCQDLVEITGPLPQMASFVISGCQSLTSISEIIKAYETINIYDCASLTNITGPLQPTANLSIVNCPRLLSIPEIIEASKTINISNCASLTNITGPLQPTANLSIVNCPRLPSAPEITGSPETALFSGCKNLTTIGLLPKTLKRVDLSNCNSLENDLLWQLHRLELKGCHISYPSHFLQMIDCLDVGIDEHSDEPEYTVVEKLCNTISTFSFSLPKLLTAQLMLLMRKDNDNGLNNFKLVAQVLSDYEDPKELCFALIALTPVIEAKDAGSKIRLAVRLKTIHHIKEFANKALRFYGHNINRRFHANFVYDVCNMIYDSLADNGLTDNAWMTPIYPTNYKIKCKSKANPKEDTPETAMILEDEEFEILLKEISDLSQQIKESLKNSRISQKETVDYLATQNSKFWLMVAFPDQLKEVDSKYKTKRDILTLFVRSDFLESLDSLDSLTTYLTALKALNSTSLPPINLDSLESSLDSLLDFLELEDDSLTSKIREGLTTASANQRSEEHQNLRRAVLSAFTLLEGQETKETLHLTEQLTQPLIKTDVDAERDLDEMLDEIVSELEIEKKLQEAKEVSDFIQSTSLQHLAEASIASKIEEAKKFIVFEKARKFVDDNYKHIMDRGSSKFQDALKSNLYIETCKYLHSEREDGAPMPVWVVKANNLRTSPKSTVCDLLTKDVITHFADDQAKPILEEPLDVTAQYLLDHHLVDWTNAAFGDNEELQKYKTKQKLLQILKDGNLLEATKEELTKSYESLDDEVKDEIKMIWKDFISIDDPDKRKIFLNGLSNLQDAIKPLTIGTLLSQARMVTVLEQIKGNIDSPTTTPGLNERGAEQLSPPKQSKQL